MIKLSFQPSFLSVLVNLNKLPDKWYFLSYFIIYSDCRIYLLLIS